MARSKVGRGGRRTSDLGFPSARSTVVRRSGSPPKQRPSGLFGGDAAYHTANSPPVGRVPSHADRFAESLRPEFLNWRLVKAPQFNRRLALRVSGCSAVVAGFSLIAAARNQGRGFDRLPVRHRGRSNIYVDRSLVPGSFCCIG